MWRFPSSGNRSYTWVPRAKCLQSWAWVSECCGSPKGTHVAWRLNLEVSFLLAYDQSQIHLCWADSGSSRATTGHSWAQQPCWWHLWKNILKTENTTQRRREQKVRETAVKTPRSGRKEGKRLLQALEQALWRACGRGCCSWKTASCGKEPHRSRVKSEEEETVEANCMETDHKHIVSSSGRRGSWKWKWAEGKWLEEDEWGSSWLGIWW